MNVCTNFHLPAVPKLRNGPPTENRKKTLATHYKIIKHNMIIICLGVSDEHTKFHLPTMC